ncbi:MAG: lipopolysaccharide biosynthesis protein, partial [Bacteroidales bacterium]|nr:lipopolysaccharide biosynthesis protein [Bacteroidales bacterium]
MANTSLIFKNTLLLYLRSFIVLLISLYASRIILEELGVEDFGIYNAVGGVISMVSFVNTSLLAAYQRYYNIVMGEGDKSNLIEWFRASFGAQVLLVLSVLLISETIGLWFLNNKMIIPENRLIAANWVYQSSIVAIAFTIFQSPYTAMVTAYEKMNVFAIISVIDAVLKLLIVLVLRFVESDKLIFYSICIMGISVLDYVLYVIYVERKLDLGRFLISWNWAKIKALTAFAGYSFVDTLSQTLKSSGLNILLNVFFGPVVNAARGLAYQVLTATNQFVQSFQTAFRPQLTKSYAEKDYGFMKRLYFSSSKISFYLILLITLPIIVEASAVLHIWLGDNVPEHTVSFVRLI